MTAQLLDHVTGNETASDWIDAGIGIVLSLGARAPATVGKQILKLPLDLGSLRSASTEWEIQVSAAIEKDEDLAETVRQLEEAYDDDLLELEADDH